MKSIVALLLALFYTIVAGYIEFYTLKNGPHSQVFVSICYVKWKLFQAIVKSGRSQTVSCRIFLWLNGSRALYAPDKLIFRPFCAVEILSFVWFCRAMERKISQFGGDRTQIITTTTKNNVNKFRFNTLK